MNKLRQSLRRKKPTYVPEASRPHQWQADEEAVRKGKCSFAVRVGNWTYIMIINDKYIILFVASLHFSAWFIREETVQHRIVW